MPPNISNVKTILLPSGRDYKQCREALREVYDITLPNFSERELSTRNNNIAFVRVKGKDIPQFIKMGYGDLGITSFDAATQTECSDLSFKRLGKPICTFELLIPEASKAEILMRLYNKDQPAVSVATSFPNLLQRYTGKLNIQLSKVQPTGSAEAMTALGVAEAVADTVASGQSARANRLVRIHLENIYPTVIWKFNAVNPSSNSLQVN